MLLTALILELLSFRWYQSFDWDCTCYTSSTRVCVHVSKSSNEAQPPCDATINISSRFPTAILILYKFLSASAIQTTTGGFTSFHCTIPVALRAVVCGHMFVSARCIPKLEQRPLRLVVPRWHYQRCFLVEATIGFLNSLCACFVLVCRLFCFVFFFLIN